MIKEPKNIDFYTSGRQPSEEEFTRISEWIRKMKKTSLRAKKEGKDKKKVHIIKATPEE